jgi:hypothetical protein
MTLFLLGVACGVVLLIICAAATAWWFLLFTNHGRWP